MRLWAKNENAKGSAFTLAAATAERTKGNRLPIRQTRVGDTCYPDHLNTSREIYDQNQQLVWRRSNQEPFGDSPPDENPSGLGTFEHDLGFPGQRRDRETGLWYNDQRDGYNPTIGGYTQPEPIGLAGDINLYRYAQGNPLSYIDPDGRFAFVIPALPALGAALAEAAAVVGGAIASQGAAIAGAAAIIATASISGSTSEEERSPSRTIPQPKRPSCGCTCICRADADDRIPGNVKPGMPRFAFGEATEDNCPKAVKEAKRRATRNLGMQPKHIPCKCAGN